MPRISLPVTAQGSFTSRDRSADRHSMSEVLPFAANFHPLRPKLRSWLRKARLLKSVLSIYTPLICRVRSLGARSAAMLSIWGHTSGVFRTTVRLTSEPPKPRTHLALDWVMGWRRSRVLRCGEYPLWISFKPLLRTGMMRHLLTAKGSGGSD